MNNTPWAEPMLNAFYGFGEFAVIDDADVMTALAVDSAGLSALIASEKFPEPTHAGKWSIPHVRSHLRRLGERDLRDPLRDAISTQEANSIRFIAENEARSMLGCDRAELWGKILAGGLPWPVRSNGKDVWQHDDVLKARRKEQPRSADPFTLLNESQVMAELGCDSVGLYRKVIDGTLPHPQKSNGCNVWFYSAVMNARGIK